MRCSLAQDDAARMELRRSTVPRMTPSTAVRSCRALTVTADNRVFVIAGPNGAGKTTFATEFLPNEADCPLFVNADLIAAGLSPFGSGLVAIEAARADAATDRRACAMHGRSFAFETTLERASVMRAGFPAGRSRAIG